MSLVSAILGGPAERKAIDISPLTWSSLFGEPSSKAGVSVSVDTALRVSAVLGCCRVLAEDLAKLPFKLMRETQGGRKAPAYDHPLHSVLYLAPNEWQTSIEFRETLMFHAVLAKGGFAFINRASDGRVLELIPLLPGNVTPRLAGPLRQMVYDVVDGSGHLATLPRSSVFAVRGPSWDGVSGMEMVAQAREAIGLGIAIEDGQARFHANGARPGGILSAEADAKLEPKTIDRIRAQFAEAYGGANAFRVAVLDKAFKYQQMAMTGVDAQTLESRKFQVEEVCRILRVSPQKVFYSDKTTTYASSVENNRAHAGDSIHPWKIRWEQSASRDLLTKDERAAGYFPFIDLRGAMEADDKARAEYYKASLGTASSPGWNTPNDVRRLEDQDPSADPGADKLVTVDRFAGAAPAQDGKPGEGTPLAPTAGDGTVVQDTALNGAQVASLLQIVQAVASDQLPESTARAMIKAAFPAVDDATIYAMLKGLDGFTPAAPDPAKPAAAK